MKYIFWFIVIALINKEANTQTLLPTPKSYQNAYDKKTRSIDGKPGAVYWQNKAAYTIDVSFFPVSRIISGTEKIIYTNNSPDTLKQIWFKLYPNLYAKGSERDMHIDAADINDGVHITSMKENDSLINTDKLNIQGTNLTIKISPLLPGKQMNFDISFSYILNKTLHKNVRGGMVDDSAAFIAYFFPRIAVYDDIDGWNQYPYTGLAEFYNDFCDFDVSINVPKNYIVCATGDLQNANDVYMPQIVQRINEAEKNDAVTKVIDTSDLNNGKITTQNEMNTWKFIAGNITDFVFATSNHYIWYASSLIVDSKTQRRTRVDAVFNPEHKNYFDVIDLARQTVAAMSYRFPAWPFPYPHETVFDGQGKMEYPMMVNDLPVEDRTFEIILTSHEISHTMFPFYVGINETKYGWMDEGWATLIGNWTIPPMIDSSKTDWSSSMKTYNAYANTDFYPPIITPSTEESGVNYFINSYPKPALGYLYVKDLLGDELFIKSIHYYIQQWHGKHPMPLDFFNCMNAGSGKNLNWFWKRWFFESGFPDLAITNVKQNGTQVDVTVQMKGNMPVPVHLTIFYQDGSIEKLHQSIACWESSNSTTVSLTSNKPVQKIVLGEVYDADVNPNDNIWKVK